MTETIYGQLETAALPRKLPCLSPQSQPEVVHMDTPAMEVLIDFKKRAPLLISSSQNIHDALSQMQLHRALSLFVTDENQAIIGLISAKDIQGLKPIMLAREQACTPKEVTLYQMMQPLSSFYAMDSDVAGSAYVGHIAKLLHDLNCEFLFVTENDENGEKAIRGLFSAPKLSHQLDDFVGGDFSAHNISELQQELHKVN